MNYRSGSQSEPYDPAGDHINFVRATGEGWKISGPYFEWATKTSMHE
jgi:hypothetical protein